MTPVMKGQSLMEVMEYWSLNDFYVYNFNIYYEGVHDRLIAEREKRLAKLEQKG